MVLVGIAGGSGSGKTTFAEKVVNLIGKEVVLHLHQDAYYLSRLPEPLLINGKPNFDHPDAFDWALLRSHLREIKEGKAVECPVYDFVTSSRKPQTTRVGPAKAVVFDGIFALWDQQIRETLDFRIFLEVDADIRFIRRLHRDVKVRGRNLDGIISQYYDSVRPMHRRYIEPTNQFADILVGEETDIAAEIVANHIRTKLAIENK